MNRPGNVRCSGIALTEMVVSMLALLPLMFAVPMIGKLVDVRQRAVLASRHVAWEATVRSKLDHDDMSRQLRTRFFPAARSARSGAVGNTAASGSVDTAESSGLPGQTAVHIIPGSVRALPYETGFAADTTVARVGKKVVAAGRLLESLDSTDWSLTGNGLVRGGLSMQVQSNGWSSAQGADCEPGVFGCVTEQSVILVDGWGASSDAQAGKRVRSLVPAAALEPVGKALSLVGVLPVFRELRQLDGAFGKVNMEVLPDYLEDAK